MTANDRLHDLLGIDLPIIQAPMAGVSSPAMAAAAGQAGALGSIGAGATHAADAGAMIAAVRAGFSGPLNVNLFCHRPAEKKPAIEAAWIERWRPVFASCGATPPPALREIYRSFVEDGEMLNMLLATRPSTVSFHFGLPGPAALRALRDAGITLLGSVTSLAEARICAAAGIDAIVAQGWEAGGHRGVFDPDAPDDQLTTLALTRLLVRETGLPVIAAGGIMDGAGIAAALQLGAIAAQLGTAFIGCDESLADAGYRQALFSEAALHTRMTRVISGRPARCLANRFIASAAEISATASATEISASHIPAYPIAYDLGKALHAAAKAKGDFGYGAQWAGQSAKLARAMPAGQLAATLAAELEQSLPRLIVSS